MRGTRHMLAAAMASGLLLAGCGDGSTEQEIASEACDLLSELADAGLEVMMDPEAMQEYEQQFADLERRADEADLDDEDMEQAMREECPEVFEQFDDMAEMEMDPEDFEDLDDE